MLSGLSQGVRAENIAFLLQQSIEKSLKAYLCALGLPVPLVHDLGVLIAKIPSEKEPPFGYEIIALSEYSGIRRYEEGSVQLDKSDLEDMFKKTKIVLNWLKSEIVKG